MPFNQEFILFIIQQSILYSLFFVLLLIIGIFYLQIKQHKQAKQEKRFNEFLIKYFKHENIKPIRLDGDRFLKFISFWSTSFNANIIDKSKLIEMAHKLKLKDLCLKQIKSTLIFTSWNLKKISLIIHTLGNILQNDENSLDVQKELESLSTHSQYMIVFESCIALLKINPIKYYSFVIDKIFIREDWSNKELKYIMSFYKSKEALQIIEELIKTSNTDKEKRIIQIASTTDHFSYFVSYILEHQESFSDDSISLAIKNIDKIEDFNRIVHLKESPNWIFKLNIIQAISSLSYFSYENLDYLYGNLSNSNWWIRNRSAQALVQYYNFDYNAINLLISKTTDHFARDALIGAVNQAKLNKLRW